MAVKQRIAVVPQRPNLDRQLKAIENLTFHAAYFGYWACGAPQARAGGDGGPRPRGPRGRARQQPLRRDGPAPDHRPGAHAPPAGPLPRRAHDRPRSPVAALPLGPIEELREAGTTILLTTHDMVEADRLCDTIAIVDHGTIVALDTPSGLRRLLPGAGGVEVVATGMADAEGALRLVRRGRGRRDRRRSPPGPDLRRRRRSRGDRRAVRDSGGGDARAAAPGGQPGGRLRAPHGEGSAVSLAPEPPRLAVRAATVRSFLAAVPARRLRHAAPRPWGFLAQSLIAPLFFLFIFGRVLPEIGAAGRLRGAAAARGARADARAHRAAGRALSLVIEFSFTKEIEDRLLAPIPRPGRREKIVFAAPRIVAGLVILPARRARPPGGLQLSDATWWTFAPCSSRAACRRGDRPRHGDRGAAEPDQRRLRRRADAAAVHGRDVLPVAVAGLAALVPGADALQPADLRERGDARVADGRSASRLGLDRARASRSPSACWAPSASGSSSGARKD